MKIPLRKIVSVEFSQAYGRLLKLPMTAKQSYHLVKAMRRFDAEAKDFQKVQQVCCEKHGIQPGKEYPREKVEALQAELDELLERKVEVNGEPIVIPPDAVISASDLVLLEELVVLDETALK